MNDAELFEQRLAETIAWCERQPGIFRRAEYLRSPLLKPTIQTMQGFQLKRVLGMVPSKASLHMVESDEAAAMIDATGQRREELLAESYIVPERNTTLAGGRLLAYFVGASAHDGTTASITDYFDIEDNPPWDTWVYFVAGKEQIVASKKNSDFRSVLDGSTARTIDYAISWVPPRWIEDVEEAMRSEYMGAIMWIDTLIARPAEFKIYDYRHCYIPAWLQTFHSDMH
jgi:hypothetical protein